MQMGGCQVNAHTRPTGRGSKSARAERRLSESGGAALLHPRAVESLLLNIDASLRVHTRHHLFGWTQGMLQSLVKHELLVCALRSTRPTGYQVDCFASPWIDPERLSEVFRRDAAFVGHLVSQWVEGEFRPIVYSAGSGVPLARGAFAAELQRLGTDSVIAHGTYDSLGKPVSLFVLGAMPGDLGQEDASRLELVVPFLHLAWMRTQLGGAIEDRGATYPAPRILAAWLAVMVVQGSAATGTPQVQVRQTATALVTAAAARLSPRRASGTAARFTCRTPSGSLQ